ncbi:MAG: hypothetical protein HYV26_10280 [Candidatus Hydrogenedentes bacterium]|nr:hypothetical protein [Candidatus Hydrogenedentota bacterium]
MQRLHQFWRNLSRGTRFQVLFYSASMLVGIIMFFGPIVFQSETVKPLTTGLGIALVAASLLGFAQRLFFYDDFRSEMESLVGDALNNYLQTNMLPFLREGVERLYTDREEAISAFKKHVVESDHVIIIGSSLTGLLDPTERDLRKKEFADILRKKLEDNVRVEFLLTHPALAFLREDAEGRKPGAIKSEIVDTLKYLTKGMPGSDGNASNIGVPPQNIRLYLGTPTIFAIICSDWMLINPYTYQATAFENFCFELSKKGDQSLYSKIYKGHFRKPWNNRDTTTILTPAIMKELASTVMADVFPNRLDDLVHPEGRSADMDSESGDTLKFSARAPVSEV